MTGQRLSQGEFVAMLAAVISTAAFSVDTMLPALPAIGAELVPSARNDTQFVVTAFVIGLGIGTLFVGPLSDALGRKPVLFASSALAVLGALMSHVSSSLDMLIAARVLHGLGAAGARALAVAIVRDLYEGRRMAQVMSFVMMVFALVPAMAPLTGSFIEWAWGWRAIFLCFAAWTAVATGWLMLRQPETLPPEHRVPLRWGPIREGLAEIFGNRVVVIAILALTLTFAMLFTILVTVQQTYAETYGRVDSFPWWFALSDLIAITGSIVNARYVMRLGMRTMVIAAFAGQTLLAGSFALLNATGLMPDALGFATYFIWATSVIWMLGLTIGNLNALALEPMGHHAGLASSVVSAAATALSALVATPVGLAFDGTPVPSMTGVFLFALTGLILMQWTRGAAPVRTGAEAAPGSGDPT